MVKRIESIEPLVDVTIIGPALSAGVEVEAEDEEEAVGIELGGTTAYPWEGTDRDYKYDEVSLIYF